MSNSCEWQVALRRSRKLNVLIRRPFEDERGGGGKGGGGGASSEGKGVRVDG